VTWRLIGTAALVAATMAGCGPCPGLPGALVDHPTRPRPNDDMARPYRCPSTLARPSGVRRGQTVAPTGLTDGLGR